MDIQQFQAWLEDTDTDLGNVLALLKEAKDIDNEVWGPFGSWSGWSY